MNQFRSLCIGAIIGAAYVVAAVRPLTGLLVFIGAVASGFFGMGIYALVYGELSMGGRGGKSPVTFTGKSARLAGLGIIITITFWVFLMLSKY
jgi:hypothetical protein